MNTHRIYQKNSYQRNIRTVITDVTCRNGFDVITTESTVFFPEGGGQMGDIGEVSSDHGTFRITDTFDENLESPVFHLTDAPCGTFKVGDSVDLILDWTQRFSNMQRHTGEHMLSGIFNNLYGGVNKGFHMSSDYIAIDIDLDGRILTADEVSRAEREVNWLIWEDLPVNTTWFDSYEDSLVLPVRKQVPHDGKVSIVTVGNDGDIRDSIACCGTHVSSTGQVGLIKITKSEPTRGMTRIYFDCGMNAFDIVRADHDALSTVTAGLSCGRDDLERNIAVMKQKQDSLRARIAELTSFALDQEYDRIAEFIFACKGNSGLLTSSSEYLDTDALVKLGFRLSELLAEGQLLALQEAGEGTVLLFSNDPEIKCGSIVKEHAGRFNGRGGGRPDNARAAFKSAGDAHAFINHLREIVL